MASIWTIVGMNAAAWHAGAEGVKRSAAGLSGNIKSHLGGKIAGLFAVSAIEHQALAMTELGGKIQDTSNRLGISTDAVQQWDYALKQNGSSIEAAAPFFQKFAQARQKALEGNKEAIDSMATLGISMEELRSGARNEDLIGGNIAKAFETGDPQQLTAAMVAVGGKGGMAMAAAFRDGLAAALGDAPIISQEAIERLDEAADKIGRMKAEATAAFAPIVAGALKGVELLQDFAGATAAGVMGFFNGSGYANGVHAYVKGMDDRDKERKEKRERLAKGNKGDGDHDAVDNKEVEKLEEAQEKKDRARNERLNKLNADLKDKEQDIALIGLDAEEKRLALMKQRQEMLKDIALAQGEAEALGVDNSEEIQQRKKGLLDVDKQIKSDAVSEAEAVFKSGKHSVNSLQQMGGFLGNYALAQGPEAAAQNAQVRSADLLARIDKNIEWLAGKSDRAEEVKF